VQFLDGDAEKEETDGYLGCDHRPAICNIAEPPVL
jgi:hypothetical protein